MFDAIEGKYFKIFVERGILTYDEVVQLINDYINPESKDDFIKV